ncbi:MAG: Trm112 family protein [Planctomycetota bacterium]|nr:MAG: Trm112 family protein [Planctomycetota bacterium]
MALSPDLLEILRCPEDRTRLALADEALVARLNAAIAAGKVTNKGGEPVREAVDAGLVREDGAILYPVREDIPVLLIEEGIPLAQLDAGESAS